MTAVIWLSLGNVGGQRGHWQILLRCKGIAFEVSEVASKEQCEYVLRNMEQSLGRDPEVMAFVAMKARKLIDELLEQRKVDGERSR